MNSGEADRRMAERARGRITSMSLRPRVAQAQRLLAASWGCQRWLLERRAAASDRGLTIEGSSMPSVATAQKQLEASCAEREE